MRRAWAALCAALFIVAVASTGEHGQTMANVVDTEQPMMIEEEEPIMVPVAPLKVSSAAPAASDKLVLSDLFEVEDNSNWVADIADFTGTEDELASECAGCRLFVQAIREKQSTGWSGETDSKCPVAAESMCMTWKDEQNRHRLLRDIATGMCAKEICVRWRKCNRGKCDRCQSVVAPAAFAFASQVNGTEAARVALRQEFSEVCQTSTQGMCNKALQDSMMAELGTWANDIEDEIGLKMCQAMKECDSNALPWQTCEREVPEVPALTHTSGCTYSYTFQTDTKMKMGALLEKGGEAPKRAMTNANAYMSADFDLEKLGTTADGQHVFELLVHEAHVNNGNQRIPITFGLQMNPFYFVQKGNGKITKIIFNNRESLKTLNIKRQMAGMFHFNLAKKKSYTVEDISLDGSIADVQYTVKENGETLHVRKEAASRARDLAMTNKGKTILGVRNGVVDVVATQEKSSSGHLSENDRVHGSGLKGGMDSFAMRSNTASKMEFKHSSCAHSQFSDLVFADIDSVKAHYASKSQGEAVVTDLAAETARENPTEEDLFTVDISEEDAAKVSDGSSVVVEALARNVAGVIRKATEAETADEAQSWLNDLQAMMRADTTGRVTHEVGRILLGPGESIYGEGEEVELLQGDDKSQLRRAVMKMLLSRADGAAQNVMLRVMKHPYTSEEERRLLLTGLLAADKPTKSMVKYLNGLVGTTNDMETAATAVSVLSAMAGKMPENHEFKLSTRAHIMEMLTNSANYEPGQLVALVALGNMGSEQDMHTISEYLESHSPVLREQAALSLRRIKSPEATALLSGHFLAEPSETVRLATLNALQHRDLPSTVWLDLGSRLQAGATKFPALTKPVADSLLTILRGHGMDAAFHPAPSPAEGAGLDLEEMLEVEDSDEVTPTAGATTYKERGTGLEFGLNKFDVNKMFGQEQCSVKGHAFSFEEKKVESFGAKRFRIGLEASLYGKGQVAKNDWCASVSGFAGTFVEVLGKQINVFGFRVESSLTREARLARPILIVFGFQIAIASQELPWDAQGEETIASTLCGSVTPYTVWPPPHRSARGTNAAGAKCTCSAGFSLQGGRCVKVVGNPVMDTCPEGFRADSAKKSCVKFGSAELDCPPGFNLEDKDGGKTCVGPPSSTRKVCQDGFSVGVGKCFRYADATPDCPEGKLTADKTLCTLPCKEDCVTCPVGFSAHGSVCVRPAVVQWECPGSPAMQALQASLSKADRALKRSEMTAEMQDELEKADSALAAMEMLELDQMEDAALFDPLGFDDYTSDAELDGETCVREGDNCKCTATHNGQIECEAGFTAVGGKCELREPTRQTCRAGYSGPVNGKCLPPTCTSNCHICPAGQGWVGPDNGECKRKVEFSSYCKEGTKTQDGKCRVVVGNLVGHACPSGFVWEERLSKCTKVVAPVERCESGTEFNGRCKRTSERASHCPSGYSFSNSGKCSKTVPSTLTCPTGLTLKGSRCIESREAGEATCTPGFFMNKGRCLHQLAKELTCAEGFNLVGNTCEKLSPAHERCVGFSPAECGDMGKGCFYAYQNDGEKRRLCRKWCSIMKHVSNVRGAQGLDHVSGGIGSRQWATDKQITYMPPGENTPIPASSDKMQCETFCPKGTLESGRCAEREAAKMTCPGRTQVHEDGVCYSVGVVQSGGCGHGWETQGGQCIKISNAHEKCPIGSDLTPGGCVSETETVGGDCASPWMPDHADKTKCAMYTDMTRECPSGSLSDTVTKRCLNVEPEQPKTCPKGTAESNECVEYTAQEKHCPTPGKLNSDGECLETARQIQKPAGSQPINPEVTCQRGEMTNGECVLRVTGKASQPESSLRPLSHCCKQKCLAPNRLLKDGSCVEVQPGVTKTEGRTVTPQYLCPLGSTKEGDRCIIEGDAPRDEAQISTHKPALMCQQGGSLLEGKCEYRAPIAPASCEQGALFENGRCILSIGCEQGDAPAKGSYHLVFNRLSMFNMAMTVRYGTFAFRVILGMQFEAGVILEPCTKLGNGRMVAGVDPRIDLSIATEGGIDIATVGAGVGLDIAVFQGDVVMTGIVHLNQDEPPKCPAITHATAIHLNWQALAGKFYGFAAALGFKKEMFSLCFPPKSGPELEVTRFLEMSNEFGDAVVLHDDYEDGFHTLEDDEEEAAALAHQKQMWSLRGLGASAMNKMKSAYSSTKETLSSAYNSTKTFVSKNPKEHYAAAKEWTSEKYNSVKVAVSNSKVVKVAKSGAAAVRRLLETCKAGAGFFYHGIRPLAGKCECHGGSKVDCPPAPENPQFRIAKFVAGGEAGNIISIKKLQSYWPKETPAPAEESNSSESGSKAEEESSSSSSSSAEEESSSSAAEAPSSSPSTPAKKPAAEPTKAPSQLVKQTFDAEKKRTDQVAAKTEEQVAKTAARENARVKSANKDKKKRVAKANRDAGREGRTTIRNSARRVASEARKTVTTVKNLVLRSEERQKKSLARQETLEKRLAKKLEKGVQKKEAMERQEDFKEKLAGEAKTVGAADKRVLKDIHNHEERDRFRRARKDAKRISRSEERAVKRKEAREEERNAFKKLESDEDRKFKKIDQDRRETSLKRFVRRKENKQAKARRAADGIEKSMSRAAESKRERRRLARLEKKAEKSVDERAALRRSVRSTLNAESRVAKAERRSERRSAKSLKTVLHHHHHHGFRKFRKFVRRADRRQHRAQRMRRLKSSLSKGFHSVVRADRTAEHRVVRRMRTTKRRERDARRGRQLSAEERRSIRRTDKTTRKMARSVAKAERRREERVAENKEASGLRKSLSRTKKSERATADRVDKTIRKDGRRAVRARRSEEATLEGDVRRDDDSEQAEARRVARRERRALASAKRPRRTRAQIAARKAREARRAERRSVRSRRDFRRRLHRARNDLRRRMRLLRLKLKRGGCFCHPHCPAPVAAAPVVIEEPAAPAAGRAPRRRRAAPADDEEPAVPVAGPESERAKLTWEQVRDEERKDRWLERKVNKGPNVSKTWLRKQRKLIQGPIKDKTSMFYSKAKKEYAKAKQEYSDMEKYMAKTKDMFGIAEKWRGKFRKYRLAANKVLKNVRAGVHRFQDYSARAQHLMGFAHDTVNTINQASRRYHLFAKGARGMNKRFRQAKRTISNWRNKSSDAYRKANNAYKEVAGAAGEDQFAKP